MTGSGAISTIIAATTTHDMKLILAVGELVDARVVNLLEDGKAVLGIRGKMITAATDVVLEKNAVVTFRVADIAKDNTVTLQFQGYKETPKSADAAPAPALVPGAVLRGIIGKNAEGAPVILLPRGEVPVRPEMPLQPGSQVFVRVVAGEHGPEFELLRQTPPASATPSPTSTSPTPSTPSTTASTPSTPLTSPEVILAEVPAKWQALPKVTAALDQVVEKLRTLGVDSKPLEEALKKFPDVADLTPVALKHALEKGGVLLEAKLRQALRFPEQAALVVDDLKGRLLQTAKLLELAGTEGKDVAPAKEAVQGLLRQVEDFQLLSAAQNSLKSFLPLMWPGLSEGDLEFRRTADGEASSCRINLDMAEHGELAVMILFASGGFSVYLRPDAEPFRKTLATNVGRLREMFAAGGLVLRNVDVVDRESRVLEQMEDGVTGAGEVRVMV